MLPFSFSEGTPITRGKMAVYTYNPYRGTDLNITEEENPFNRTELLPRMYHPDGTYWNGNRTIIRLAGKRQGKAMRCNRIVGFLQERVAVPGSSTFKL